MRAMRPVGGAQRRLNQTHILIRVNCSPLRTMMLGRFLNLKVAVQLHMFRTLGVGIHVMGLMAQTPGATKRIHIWQGFARSRPACVTQATTQLPGSLRCTEMSSKGLGLQ